MLYHLIFFTFLSVGQGATSYYSNLPEDDIGLLGSEDIDVMLTELKGDSRCMEMVHTYSVPSDPEPVYIDNQLYGIYDQSNNTVLGVSLNISISENWLNTTEFRCNKNYIITSVNDTMIGLDTIPIQRENWTSIEYVLAYVAGGAILNLATQCTKSSLAMKVYKTYVAVGALPFQLIIVFTLYPAQFIWKLVLKFITNIFN